MVEIDQKLALLTELLFDLIGDPGRPVADAMHPRVRPETRTQSTVKARAPRPRDATLEGSAVAGPTA